MTQLYMAGATLPQLLEFVRYEAEPVRSRRGNELWLSLPHDYGFPLYTTVRATAELKDFVARNSIYGDEHDLDKSHYLEAVFRDDETALVVLKYQQILGSRWLCIVPQAQIFDFVRDNPVGAASAK